MPFKETDIKGEIELAPRMPDLEVSEQVTISDVYNAHQRIASLLEKAKNIPDSHWKDVDEVVRAMKEVENYLEGNIGSEDL